MVNRFMRRRALHALALAGSRPVMAPLAPLAALAALTPTGTRADGYPERPVRVIQPFAAGNTLDVALRQVSEQFIKATGQPLLIDNKPGGAGVIAAQACATAAPDGYTLMLGNTSMLTINPHTFSKLPYDPMRSFKPVTNFLGGTMVYAAGPAAPAASLKEWIAYVKSHPGSCNFASFTAGNSSHFAGVLLNQRAGLDMVHVPHNGTPQAVQNLLGGQVQTAFLPLMAVKQQVEAGKLKVLAVTSGQRSSHLPDVPTFVEEGFPDLEIAIWSALMAPAGTPDAMVARLNAEFTRILRMPEIRDKWRVVDYEPMPTTPEQTTRYIQTDSRRWAEAVRLSGFKAD